MYAQEKSPAFGGAGESYTGNVSDSNAESERRFQMFGLKSAHIAKRLEQGMLSSTAAGTELAAAFSQYRNAEGEVS